MRWIEKRPEPKELAEWRSRYQNDLNFGYALMRLDHDVANAVTQSLIAEQGWICAYTGQRIERDSCHIEHINAQTHCARGEDVSYSNLAACYPAPNTGEALYGAHQKRDWPAPTERYLFVSPLHRGCEDRFRFNLRGKVSTREGDTAARTTVQKLKLDHKTLTALRREAIQSTLKDLPIDKARQRLRYLEQKTTDRLEPYCFALKQALHKHIQRLEYIRQSKRRP